MKFTDSTMLHIGKSTQYFFDDIIIEQIQDITKVVHSPVKEPGPIVKKDRPWEHVPYFTQVGWAVIRDSSDGKFKCWYEDWDIDPKNWGISKKGTWNLTFSRLCYAHSDDGLNWEKPALEYHKEKGQKTNIVHGGSSLKRTQVFNLFEDPLEKDPKKRLKMFFVRSYPGEYDMQNVRPEDVVQLMEEYGAEELCIAYSSDGIRWELLEETPEYGMRGEKLIEHGNITVDEETGTYRMITRHAGMGRISYDDRRPRTDSFLSPIFPQDVGRMNKRRIFQAVSKDLIHWSSSQCILSPDEDDNLDDSYYGMTHFRMGELYVGFLNVLHEVSNTMEVRLAYSRDGWHWYQVNQRRPWLTISADSWDRYMVNSSSIPIPIGNEFFIYYGGASNHHDWWISGLQEKLQVSEANSLDEVNYALGLARLRLDGFVSVDAGPVREGILITRVLRTDGHKLVLNARCDSGGSVEVEVTDSQDRILEGYSRKDCDVFRGDDTEITISWKNNPLIKHPGSLRLRFFMRKASLYSFKFQN